jgi:hypothetical protein
MNHLFHKTCLFVIAIGFAATQGCKSPGIATQAPSENYMSVEYKPKPSSISVPVEIDVKSVETLLNKEISGLIYEDNSLENNNNDNMMLKVWKRDNFKIDMEGDQLSYRIPLKIWAKAGFKFQKLGITISDYRDINLEIALKFKTKVALNKDWSIATKTTTDGYDWISQPTVNIAGYNLPITFVVDAILKANQTRISNEVDDAIKSNLDIKSLIAAPWKMIQKPFKLSDEYKMWLKITPTEVYSQPLMSKNNKIKNTIGFKTITETFIGNEPPYKISPTPPQLSILNKIDDGFEINVLSDIPISEANTLARKYLLGKTFDNGNKKITINEMRLYGGDGKIIVETEVSGSLNGKLYFTGVPYYNPVDSTVRIKDFNFEMHTKNALLKSANWLMHGSFVNMIEKRMVFPLSDNIKEARKMIQTSLTNYNMGMGTTLNGKLDDLTVDGILLTRESIKASIVFKGKLTVLINPALK